tara:strand:- start:6995 stop:7795 length:801 start_codon:yes stop_codon:yes gene_type:complete
MIHREKKMNTMIITALFDIKRADKGDGRTIENYLQWFQKTLQLKCHMTIYTEERFKDFVFSNRENVNYETRIIVQNLNEIPFYKNKPRMDLILNDKNYLSKIKDPHRIECCLPEYNLIQYSKFGWLKRTAQECKDIDYFFWMDAGCSRFFETFDISNLWPNTSTLDKEKFLIQGNQNFLKMWKNLDINEYIWDSNCVLVGTLFGGGLHILVQMNDIIEEVCETMFFANNCFNNEQLALAIAAKLHPHLFDIRVGTGSHLPLFIALS